MGTCTLQIQLSLLFQNGASVKKTVNCNDFGLCLEEKTTICV